MANTINYGNEPDALQLLRPPKSVERGVHEEHYMAIRSKDEVRDLVADAGIELEDGTFEHVFKMAADADGEEAKCCLVSGTRMERRCFEYSVLGFPRPLHNHVSEGCKVGAAKLKCKVYAACDSPCCCLTLAQDTFFRARHHHLAQTITVRMPM